MEELVRQYAAPVALALAIGYLGRYVQPRSRVVHWFPVNFQFQVPIPNNPTGQTAPVLTHQLSVQNLGYRAARAVEIIHQQRPQHFQIQPAVMFTEATNPAGQDVIRIDTLARREFLAIQVLGVGAQPPNLVGIRSADGPSSFTQTGLHFVWSKPRQWMFLLFLIVGFVTTVSWAARMVAHYGPMLFVR